MVVDSNRLWSVIEKVKSSCRGRHAGGYNKDRIIFLSILG